MIRTVLFDLGNVLLHFSHERMCRQIGALCDREWEHVHAALFETGLEAEFERGRIGEEEFQRRLEAALECGFDTPSLRRAGADIFELNAPMVPILDGLKRSGRRLVLLSNTNVAHVEWIRARFDVLQRFDALVLSCEAGAIKPEAQIYAAALETIACAPGECFYTDDIAAYVARGREFGLEAEVFAGAEGLARDLRRHGVEWK